MAAQDTPADVRAPTGPEARRAAEMERWRQRSKRIIFYRRALPWSMLAIVVAVAGWVGLRAYLSARQGDVAAATSAIHMTNPKFYGRDQKGRSFQLAAKDAVRDVKDANLVTLNEPGMTLDTGGKAPIKVEGGMGTYREDSKQLLIVGGVRFQDGRGSDFRSETASVDTQAGVVSGEKSVVGHGPLGQITASSYAVHDNGARVLFRGNVHVHTQGQ